MCGGGGGDARLPHHVCTPMIVYLCILVYNPRYSRDDNHGSLDNKPRVVPSPIVA